MATTQQTRYVPTAQAQTVPISEPTIEPYKDYTQQPQPQQAPPSAEEQYRQMVISMSPAARRQMEWEQNRTRQGTSQQPLLSGGVSQGIMNLDQVFSQPGVVFGGLGKGSNRGLISRPVAKYAPTNKPVKTQSKPKAMGFGLTKDRAGRLVEEQDRRAANKEYYTGSRY